MSISRRRDRVRIYTHSDAGTDGELAPTYTFAGERWGGRVDVSARETRPALQADHTVTTVFELPDDAPITVDSLLRVGLDCYWVRSVLPRRIRRALEIQAEWIEDPGRFVAPEFLDGTYLLDGTLTLIGERSSLVEA